MKCTLAILVISAIGIWKPQFAESKNANMTAAQAAWSRVLAARGFDRVSIDSIVVVEHSRKARLEATFVHSNGRGWWILWDQRPTVLGAALEVYDTAAQTASSSLANNNEFVNPVSMKFDFRTDYRLQFLAVYELNSPEFRATPVSVSPCADASHEDCLVLKAGDRTITYRIDRITYFPKEVTIDIPPQKARAGGVPAPPVVSMTTKLGTYKNVDGLMQPEKIERNGASFDVEVSLNPSIRSDLFEPMFSHRPANKMAWQASR